MIHPGEMALWTQADADAVKAAILALSTGARVYSVTYVGPPQRVVQYAAVQLPELRALWSEIQRALQASPTFRRVSFNKGFDPPGSDGLG